MDARPAAVTVEIVPVNDVAPVVVVVVISAVVVVEAAVVTGTDTEVVARDVVAGVARFGVPDEWQLTRESTIVAVTVRRTAL